MFYGTMQPQFFGVRSTAANIGQRVGNYTAEQFQEDFPQFFTPPTEETASVSLVPQAMLHAFIAVANTSLQPDKWLEQWRIAVGLYVAHRATLYLRTYSQGSADAQQAAASGALVGITKSAELGDVSITYDTSSVTGGTENWGDFNSTVYGQQLANMAKLVGMGGSYVL